MMLMHTKSEMDWYTEFRWSNWYVSSKSRRILRRYCKRVVGKSRRRYCKENMAKFKGLVVDEDFD